VDVDLGEIRIEKPPAGEHWWRGLVEASVSTSKAVSIDRIWFQPLDDGAGRLRATALATAGVITSEKTPATIAEEASGSTHAWVNKAFITSTKSSEATLTEVPSGEKSYILRCTNAGFVVPGEVKGIEVKLAYILTAGYAELKAIGYRAAEVGSSRVKFLTTSGQLTLGGPTDLWGTTWTGLQVEAATFGVDLTVAGLASVTSKVYLYGLTITVYWAFAGVTTPEDAVINASKETQVRYDGAYREDPGDTGYVRISEETGDLFRIPPSGMEGRAVQLIAKQARGLMQGFTGEPGVDEGIKDKARAQVIYRPCYIGRI
jgi:hypothetical protein